MTMSFLKGLHRRTLGINHEGQVMSRPGFASGGEDGRAVFHHSSPTTVVMFEDFIGLTGGDTGELSTRYGTQLIIGFSDTGQIVPRQGPSGPAATFTNGVFRMTSSATSAQDPVAGCQSLNTPANFKANSGETMSRSLRMGARLKTNTLAGNSVFVGFTDSGGTEMPAYDTGGGILTPAADYAGFIWSGEGGATQQAYRFVTGKAGVDQAATTGITPTAGVYDSLEVEISPNGNVATGYINGKAVAQITGNAVTSNVYLAAGIWRANTDGAANALDIDWITAASQRDTGL